MRLTWRCSNRPVLVSKCVWHSDQRQTMVSGDSPCELLGLGGTTLLLLLLLSLAMAGNLMVVGTDRIGVGSSHSEDATHSVSDTTVFGFGMTSFPGLNTVSDDTTTLGMPPAEVVNPDFWALSAKVERDGDFWVVYGDSSEFSFWDDVGILRPFRFTSRNFDTADEETFRAEATATTGPVFLSAATFCNTLEGLPSTEDITHDGEVPPTEMASLLMSLVLDNNTFLVGDLAPTDFVPESKLGKYLLRPAPVSQVLGSFLTCCKPEPDFTASSFLTPFSGFTCALKYSVIFPCCGSLAGGGASPSWPLLSALQHLLLVAQWLVTLTLLLLLLRWSTFSLLVAAVEAEAVLWLVMAVWRFDLRGRLAMTLAVTDVSGVAVTASGGGGGGGPLSRSFPPHGQQGSCVLGAIAETVLQEGADVVQWRLCTGGVTIPQYGGAGRASVAVVATFLRGEQSSLPSEAEEWVDAVL